MADDTTQDPKDDGQDPPADGKQDPPKDETPPWGDDFDPQRAWKTITSLREKEKEAARLAGKVKEYEDAQKTEAEKAAERLATAEKTAADSTSEAMRLRVALAKAPEGIKPEQILRAAKRIAGSTEEELAADAEDYFSDLAPSTRSTTTRKPQERLRGGGDPEEEPDETDPRKLAAAIRGR